MKKLIVLFLFISIQLPMLIHGESCQSNSPFIVQSFVPDEVKVINSNTLSIITNGFKKEVSLYGICQTGLLDQDKQAERLIKSLLSGRKIEIINQDKGEYCQDLVVVIIDGANLNEEMIHNGRALIDKTCKASFCKHWIDDEKRVQAHRAGLWRHLDIAEQQQEKYRSCFAQMERASALRDALTQQYRENSIRSSQQTDVISYGDGASSYSYSPSDSGRPKTVHVRDYYRKDGTHVRSHYRSSRR